MNKIKTKRVVNGTTQDEANLARLSRRLRKLNDPNVTDTATEHNLLRQLDNLLQQASRAGFSVTLDVGKPAPPRQTIVIGDLKLKPLDGSDLLSCSCCGSRYEFKSRSKHVSNYVPLNWCPSCRQGLMNGEDPVKKLMDNADLRSRQSTHELMTLSSQLVRTTIESWGSWYKSELERLRGEFDARWYKAAETNGKPPKEPVRLE